MRYGSVCSGIEAATVAWAPLGWEASFYSEIDPFARKVLKHHYPETPLHGDFTTIKAGQYRSIDLLVGGTPCQSFSIAGLRGGLDDDRGVLALEFLRLADRLRPRWVVWENVTGVLSMDGGRAFGSILGGLAECGYGFSYRVFDAQYFGLAQRRRRVFVVGHLGNWGRAAAVLFERAGLSGHLAPRREAGKRIAPRFSARPSGGGGLGTDFDLDGGLISEENFLPEISPALKARDFKGPSSQGVSDGAPLIAHALRSSGFDASEDGTGRGTPLITVHGTQDPNVFYDVAHTLGRNFGQENAVAFAQNASDQVRMVNGDGSVAGALRSSSRTRQSYVACDLADTPAASANQCTGFHGDIASQGFAVRRLTPRECERLQGFPDDYTLIPVGKGLAKDGPRYRALGNSFPVPVIRWIGRRIEEVEKIA